MAYEILVVLKRSDRIKDFLPYLEEIGRPGTRVTVLVQHGVIGLSESMNSLLAIHTGICPTLLPHSSRKEMVMVDEQSLTKKQDIAPACESLIKKGLDVKVIAYVRQWRKLVRQYTKQNDIHLIMMRRGFGHRTMVFFRRCRFISRLSTPAMLPPILLLHPMHPEQRQI